MKVLDCTFNNLYFELNIELSQEEYEQTEDVIKTEVFSYANELLKMFGQYKDLVFSRYIPIDEDKSIICTFAVKDKKKEYGLIEDYLYGRILGEDENMILDTTKDELRIYWCLDKLEVFINNRFVPFSDVKIETLVGSYARVPKDSFPLLNY